MSAITLTPKAVEAVNRLCDENSLNAHVCHLGNAVDALQRAAYDDDSFSYMFRYAYELKLLRDEFMNLQEILGYERE